MGKKLEIAHRIHELVTVKHGLASSDLFFDPLTFTIGSGDEKLRDAAIQTLEAIKAIKKELPACHSVLGLSNISFGLPVGARKVLNSVFLHEAEVAGLDAVIIDPASCIPLDQIDKKERNLALDLLYNKTANSQSPLMTFINYFENCQTEEKSDKSKELEPEELLHKHVLQGNRQDIDDILLMLFDRYSPLAIINQLLVPAMREVGQLFGAGEMSGGLVCLDRSSSFVSGMSSRLKLYLHPPKQAEAKA